MDGKESIVHHSRRRRYSFAREKQELKTKKFKTAAVHALVRLHLPLVKCQKLFEKVGMFIGRHPKLVILVTFLFLVFSGLGFVRIRRVNTFKDLFYPVKIKSAHDMEILERHFGSGARRQEVILVSISGANILNVNCLREALKVHNVITNITGFQSICVKRNNNNRAKKIVCKVTTPLELLDFNSDSLSNFSKVFANQWKGKPELLSDGRTLPYQSNEVFGEFQMEEKNGEYRFSATAIKTTYYLKQPQTASEKILVRDWEKVFISRMKSIKKQMSCASVYFASDGDGDGVVLEIFTPHILPLLASVPVLLLFTFMSLKLFTATKGSTCVFILGVVCTAMSVLCSVSIGFLAGIPFSNAVILVIIFLAGKGVSDAFLIIHEMERRNEAGSLLHRIGGCVTKVGLIFTTTALFNAVVYGFTLLSPFRGIRDAYFVALVATPVAYFISTSFLLGCSVLGIRKCSATGYDRPCHAYLCCNKTVPPSPTEGDIDEMVTGNKSKIMTTYGDILTSTPAKMVVVMLTIGIIAYCAYIHRVSDEFYKFQDNTDLSPSPYYHNFREIQLRYFNEIDVNIVLSGQIDYKKATVQIDILNMSQQLSRKYGNPRNNSNWLASLLLWSKKNGVTCTEFQFFPCLRQFLATPENSGFREDIMFVNNTKSITSVAESRIHLFTTFSGVFASDAARVKALRKDAGSFTKYILVATSRQFLPLDMLLIFKEHCFKILTVIGLALLLCSQPLTASLRVGILLVLSFALHVQELTTLIRIWDVPLNPVSFQCLFIGLMLALEFNIQMAQVRAVSPERTVEERTKVALCSIGPSILHGVSTAIVCSLSLAFILPHLSVIFLCVLPLFLVLSLFHSLALLPTIMLLSSKPAEACTKRMALEESFDMKPLTKLSMQQLWKINETYDKARSTTRNQTVSIIGIGCRFPQAENKEKFWEMLTQGRCAVSTFPANRPEEYDMFQALHHPKRFVTGRLCTVSGSFFENVRGFDAGFFKISPQEAPAMDPQQRILLQVVYEAIEDAGLRLEDLQQCRTGVFVGVMNLDYGARVMQPDNRVNMDQFYSTGTTASIVANRISFCLNLTGPSLAVDTACSSSLTALKIAQECLNSSQCDVAIVCAPNIILDPAVQITFSIGGLLAPDGRCKCFDASGDGYGRGEGFAAVVLKPTQVSLADDDDIYCEILACGMNNDGQNAMPITAPSPKTQAELSAAVLEEAGINAIDIEYVEAHGTGTAIGDVVETASIAKTYCEKTAVNLRTLRIGSVKSNLNHTESASGLTGLIKVSLMIKRGKLVPTINIENPNPKLRLSDKGIEVQEECERWITKDGKLRTAAVNSFGYGGSNVHVILREILPKKQEISNTGWGARDNYILTLSARSEDALRNIANEFANSWLREQPDETEFKLNLCYSLTERRSQHDHRLAVVFKTLVDASDSLQSFADNGQQWDARLVSGVVRSDTQKILFVFGGQGSNWCGMGTQLMDSEPVFRKAVLSISNLIKDLGERWSLLEELATSSEKTKVMGNIVGQPATFAIQYATVKLLESWGILPAAVVGHSLGELAAACTAGALTMEEALKIVLVRSKWHETCSSSGSMAALGLSEDKARDLIAELKLDSSVSVAAVNDRKNVTISGNEDAVQCIGNHLKQANTGVFWKVLSTSRPFHSFYIEAIKRPFRAEIQSLILNPKSTRIPMYSTVVGNRIYGKQLDSEYWWRNMRESVLFYQAMKNALKEGHRMTMEIGPQPALRRYIHEIATEESSVSDNNHVQMLTLPHKAVKKQHEALLQNTVCRLYTMGYPIQWASVQGKGPHKLVRLPPYPWQERQYWYRDHPPPKTIRCVAPVGPMRKSHPFLADVKRTEQFSGVQCWETEIDLHRFPTFKDHVLIQGGPVLPGSACIEMAIAMATEKCHSSSGIEVRDVRFTNLLTLPESQVRLLRLRLESVEIKEDASFSICNVQDDGTEMALAKGKVLVNHATNVPYHRDVNEENVKDELINEQDLDSTLKEKISSMTEVPLSTFRRLTESFGFNFGPCYSLMRRIWRQGNSALCMLDMDGPFVPEITQYVIHPAFVDACFQTAVAVEDDDKTDGDVRPTVPIGVKCFAVIDPNIPCRTFCHVTKSSFGSFLTYDMKLVDSKGKIYITIEQFQSADITSLVRSPILEDIAYKSDWVESQLSWNKRDLSTCIVIVFKDCHGIADSFMTSLSRNSGGKVVAIDLPTSTELTAVAESMRSVLPAAANSMFSELIVVNFWPVEASYLASDVNCIRRSQDLAFMSSLQALNYLIEVQGQSSDVSRHLVIVSRCAQVITGEEESIIPWASTAWGMRRTASLEISSVRTTAVDLCKGDDSELDLLTSEIQIESLDNEIAFRDGKRYVNRLTRLKSERQPFASERLLYESETKYLGSVYLTLHPKTERFCMKRGTESSHSSEKEVQIQVTNFWLPSTVPVRLSDAEGCTEYLGFSGIVQSPVQSTNSSCAVQLKTGDSMMGISRQRRLGNLIFVNQKDLLPKPDYLSPQQGATLPSCLALASYALQYVTSDVKGAEVIIHEANRDLGLVGLLVAQAMGFSVICTTSDASLESSKRYLKALGALDVVDAQCSELAEHSQYKTDAALFFYQPVPNSVRKSCKALKPGGKLILLGGTSHGQIIIPSDQRISYQGITYADILDPPGRFQELWTSSVELLKITGFLNQMLKVEQREASVFDIAARLNSSQDEGKPSLNNASEPWPADGKMGASIWSLSFNTKRDMAINTEVLPVGLDQHGLKRNRTYMVVGGVRGFGFEVARWMATKGAGTIVLVARSTPSQTKLEEVAALEKETGAKIEIFQADASSLEQMTALQTNELVRLPSVAGIVLTAMVLHDQLIPQLDRDTFFKVIAPKVAGAFILHEMSLKMDLDFFVMFSSIASLLGNPGQASYSAANAFLDSLAHYRRHSLHMPALSINWGPIEGAGVLQRQANVAQLLARAGYRMIDARKGVEIMEQILMQEPLTCQLGVFDADWPRLLESSVGIKKSTRLMSINDEVDTLKTEKDLESLGPRILLEADQKKKEEMVGEFVAELLSSWVGIPPSELDLNTSLYGYGLDSFFALTFKMQLESTLQVSFEVFYFMQPDTTPAKVVQDIIAKMTRQNQSVSSKSAQTPIADTHSQAQEIEPRKDGEKTGANPEAYPKDTSCPTATYQVVPLYKPDQATVNFFCIHPAGRYAMNLVPISTGFKNQNLIAFFAIGYTDPTMTGDTRSVRELAQSYVRMIKHVQRHGPYFLGGQSFGGLVAYEMASILVEKEEEVSFVSMIDTFPWEMPNRSGAARLEILFGGKKLEHMMEELFQATFEQVLSKLATQTLKMVSEEYQRTRERKTQDETIVFLQNRAQQLDIPLYDIRELRNSLQQDNQLATRKHREWKPAAIYYNGPLIFLKSADQRFTPIKPLQESSDDAWSLLVDGNIDVYVCPGDHLALSEPADALVTGRILATAIGIQCRTLFGQLPRLIRSYKQRKAIQKFRLGVEVFLHARKGLNPPKFGTLFLLEDKGKLVFKPALTKKIQPKKKTSTTQDTKGNSAKAIDLTELRNVLPGKYVAVTMKCNFQQRVVSGYQTGNYKMIVAMVMASHRVRNFELLGYAEFKEFFLMIEAILGVTFDQK